MCFFDNHTQNLETALEFNARICLVVLIQSVL